LFFIKKVAPIGKKALTDFSVMGGNHAIDLYVDYVTDKVDELIDTVNNLIDAVEDLYRHKTK